MAHDLFSGKTPRNWSRNSDKSSSTGYDPYVHGLFNRRDYSDRPAAIVIEKKSSGGGWLGYTLAAVFATRVLSGKWPWYWGELAAQRAEKALDPSGKR